MITNLNTILSSKIDLNFNSIRQLLATDYSDVFNFYEKNRDRNIKIYRAHENIGECFILSSTYRRSLGTSNLHTVLLSSLLPSWKRYPKRDHCIIGSTDENGDVDVYMEDGEGNYNNENRKKYIILPKNNTNIAMCPTDDLWESFENVKRIHTNYGNIELNYFCEEIISIISIFHDIFKIEPIDTDDIENLFKTNNITSIISMFSKLEKCIIKSVPSDVEFYISNDILATFFYRNIRNKKTFIKLLDEILSPTINGFHLFNTKSIKLIESNKEIWFDSECLFIDADSYFAVL